MAIQQPLTPQQGERAGAVGDLALDRDTPFVARHAQRFINWDEGHLHQLSGFAMRFAQLDAGSEIDISHFVGDAVGRVELAHVVKAGCRATDFFQQLVPSNLFRLDQSRTRGSLRLVQSGWQAAGRYLAAPTSD